jgi:dienelactone hydrolase
MIEHQTSKFVSGSLSYTIDRYADKAGAATRPVVVMLHGVDGLGTQSGVEIDKFAKQLAGEGFLVFVPHYFDAADGADTLPLPQVFAMRVPRVGLYPPRIAAAVDHARTQPGADAGRLGLIGLSLGGGLALQHAEGAPAGTIKALVDFFGYISDQATLNNVSHLPPTLVLHNKADEIVKVAVSSQPLLAALDKSTVVHDHEFYDDANPPTNHPFLPGGHADVDSRARSVKWMKTHLI